MSKRMSRKELLKTDEIAEAAFDVGHWLEGNWRSVLGGVGAVAVIALAVGSWMWLAGEKRAENEALLAVAMRDFTTAEQNNFFDPNELSSALYSAEAVIEHAPSSDPGRLALYYKAVTLKQLGRVDEGIEALESLVATGWSGTTASGAADLLLANLYAENGRAGDAVTLLDEVVSSGEGGVPTEIALLRLGEIHAQQGNQDAARAAWQRVLDDFADTSAVTEARRHLDTDAG